MSDIGLLTVVALVLAAYRTTRLITSDDFPFGNLRLRLHGRWLGRLMACPFCTSVWVGGFLAAGQGLIGDWWGWQVFVGGLALSAVVSLQAAYLPASFD